MVNNHCSQELGAIEKASDSQIILRQGAELPRRSIDIACQTSDH